jgi:hypothetical protein
MEPSEVELRGDTRDLAARKFQAGVRSKGQDRGTSGATLKIQQCLGLEKASCGVELRKRASLQGFESPSPHQTWFESDISVDQWVTTMVVNSNS